MGKCRLELCSFTASCTQITNLSKYTLYCEIYYINHIKLCIAVYIITHGRTYCIVKTIKCHWEVHSGVRSNLLQHKIYSKLVNNVFKIHSSANHAYNWKHKTCRDPSTILVLCIQRHKCWNDLGNYTSQWLIWEHLQTFRPDPGPSSMDMNTNIKNIHTVCI